MISIEDWLKAWPADTEDDRRSFIHAIQYNAIQSTKTDDIRTVLDHCPECKAVGGMLDRRHKPWCPRIGKGL